MLSRILRRPDPEKLAKCDTSEAAQSDLILECVRKYFPETEITLTGGVIYFLVLEDVIHNLNEEDESDRTILDLLMIMDELCTNIPEYESLYATALAIKKD